MLNPFAKSRRIVGETTVIVHSPALGSFRRSAGDTAGNVQRRSRGVLREKRTARAGTVAADSRITGFGRGDCEIHAVDHPQETDKKGGPDRVQSGSQVDPYWIPSGAILDPKWTRSGPQPDPGLPLNGGKRRGTRAGKREGEETGARNRRGEAGAVKDEAWHSLLFATANGPLNGVRLTYFSSYVKRQVRISEFGSVGRHGLGRMERTPSRPVVWPNRRPGRQYRLLPGRAMLTHPQTGPWPILGPWPSAALATILLKNPSNGSRRLRFR